MSTNCTMPFEQTPKFSAHWEQDSQIKYTKFPQNNHFFSFAKYLRLYGFLKCWILHVRHCPVFGWFCNHFNKYEPAHWIKFMTIYIFYRLRSFIFEAFTLQYFINKTELVHNDGIYCHTYDMTLKYIGSSCKRDELFLYGSNILLLFSK